MHGNTPFMLSLPLVSGTTYTTTLEAIRQKGRLTGTVSGK